MGGTFQLGLWYLEKEKENYKVFSCPTVLEPPILSQLRQCCEKSNTFYKESIILVSTFSFKINRCDNFLINLVNCTAFLFRSTL